MNMYFEGVYLMIVCVIALVGNLCMWIIICKSQDLRTVTNAFILSLTTADLLVAAINMPVTIITIFYGDWVMSKTACQIFGFINMFTLVLSVLSLCNISINRLVMVCKPLQFKKIYTVRNAVMMITSCVILSMTLSSFPLYGWARYSYLEDQSFCFCEWTTAPSYAFFMIGCCFGIPFTVMTICNILIFRTVRASKRRVTVNITSKPSKTLQTSSVGQPISTIYPDTTTMTSSQIERLEANGQRRLNTEITADPPSALPQINLVVSDKQAWQNLKREKKVSFNNRSSKGKLRSEEIRLALTLAIVVLMFVICWLPFCISMLIGIFSPNLAPAAFHMWTLLIGYSNSCMNPVIYGALNKKFGEGFKDLLCRFHICS